MSKAEPNETAQEITRDQLAELLNEDGELYGTGSVTDPSAPTTIELNPAAGEFTCAVGPLFPAEKTIVLPDCATIASMARTK